MTEVEWLECEVPQKMLRHLRAKIPDSRWGIFAYFLTRPLRVRVGLKPRASDRKLRLFACGCCRHDEWGMSQDHYRHAVEVAERYADGDATEADLSSVQQTGR